ncbi:hypothetical protein EK21DRAFT_90657 [Setomelanomma holmii]|uniref:Apple domain-containing protein n=1 Tax=Setomelanomma holmii TaxID=210430 RepID=A0A9P4H832_9PLEO|nr:hypothetical protein EK21DRAFT_90657 [Setomelanomma holmii]
MSHEPKPSSPQIAYADAPELYNSYQHQPPPQNAPAHPATEADKKRTILGLRRQTFWLVLILVFVLLAAAVGGGVGGSIAVQNAKSKAQSTSSPSQATRVITVAPSFTSVTASQPTTSSASTALDTNIYTPKLPDDVLRVSNTCDGSGHFAVVLANRVWDFSCNANTDAPGNDIAAFVSYTMKNCLESCALTNAIQSNQKCVGVVFSENLRKLYDSNGANCYLKTTTSNNHTNTDWKLAVLST